MESFIKGVKFLMGEMESIPYTVVDGNEEFEERLYPCKKWVSIEMSGKDRERISEYMYRSLLKYMTGSNAANMRLDMTSPLITKTRVSRNGTLYAMSLFIPEANQHSPPKPVVPKMFIEEKSQFRVYSRKFGGYVNDNVIQREMSQLKNQIELTGKMRVNLKEYHVAGYDPPYKLLNRRNEIWFLEK